MAAHVFPLDFHRRRSWQMNCFSSCLQLTPVGVTVFRGIHAVDRDQPNTANSDITYSIVVSILMTLLFSSWKSSSSCSWIDIHYSACNSWSTLTTHPLSLDCPSLQSQEWRRAYQNLISLIIACLPFMSRKKRSFERKYSIACRHSSRSQ